MDTRKRIMSAATGMMLILSALGSDVIAGFGGFRGPRVVSPEVFADGKVAFRILASKAQAVRLTGSDIPGIGQGAEMIKDANGGMGSDAWSNPAGGISV